MAFHIQIVSEKAKNWTKNGQKTPQKGGFSSPSDQLAEFFRKRTRSLSGFPEKVPVIFCWNKIEPRYGISAQAGYVGSTINFFYSAKWDLCFTSGCRGPGELHEWWCLFGSRTFSITDKTRSVYHIPSQPNMVDATNKQPQHTRHWMCFRRL